MPQNGSEAAFMEQHNIEDSKFDSYEDARLFFSGQGFELFKEAEPDWESLSMALKLLSKPVLGHWDAAFPNNLLLLPPIAASAMSEAENGS